jgi:transposase
VLQNEGFESHVVDPASIATSRRRRRAKTDRIDGEALLRALRAYKRGERLRSGVNSIGSNCCLSRSRRRRSSGTRCLPRNTLLRLRQRRCCSHRFAILWSEGLFRHFDNRRQIASFAGLAPTPWQSGSVDREQGVSKAGNPRLRSTLIQLAWLWLRHQPQSVLALWFEERVRRNSGRLKKTTIVALARKLLVALWKYVTAGVVIEGAVMKAARR